MLFEDLLHGRAAGDDARGHPSGARRQTSQLAALWPDQWGGTSRDAQHTVLKRRPPLKYLAAGGTRTIMLVRRVRLAPRRSAHIPIVLPSIQRLCSC